MKKFLDILGEVPKYFDNSEVEEMVRGRHEDLINYFKSIEGSRALYTCQSIKETRVVTIEKALQRYVLMSYQCYGLDYKRKLYTTATYNGIISGMDRVSDVE